LIRNKIVKYKSMEYVSKLFTFFYDGLVTLRDTISDFLRDVFCDDEDESNPFGGGTVEIDVLGDIPPLIPGSAPHDTPTSAPVSPGPTPKTTPSGDDEKEDSPRKETDASDMDTPIDEKDETRSNISDESFEFVDFDTDKNLTED
jgi:hypothetical protein